MKIEEQILNFLNNPSKLDGIDTSDNYIEYINKPLEEVYPRINPDKRLTYVKDSAVFAMAKAMERQLAFEIRGNKISFWFVLMEIVEGAKFNLPPHLENKIYEFMDACKNAVAQYTEKNLNFNLHQLYTRIQNIGKYFVDYHNLKNVTVAGLNNDNIMTRDEFHNFWVRGACEALTKAGYTIEQTTLGSAVPCNIVCKKDDVLYHTAVVGAILPKTGELKGWRLRSLEQIKQDDKNKIAMIGVSIIPTNEFYASMGVTIKNGDYQFKVSSLQVIGQTTSNNKI